MFKNLLLFCLVGIGLAHRPNVAVLEERMPNGDENEFVSVDLMKRDGTEDIKLMAQLHFHLNANQVYVNGHPIIHSVVNSIRMRVSIVEIKTGVKMAPRLAPATFRVLVQEKPGENGQKVLIAEVEFTEVERYEVFQVDVKQIMWEGSNRRPVTSISFQESMIHQQPHNQDHHVFVPDHDFKPRLPSHGLRGEIEGYETKAQSKILCWFNQLSIGGKIAILCSAIVTFLFSLLTLVTCWRRHFSRDMHLDVPMDDVIEVDGVLKISDEKKSVVTDDGEFHIVDVDDKRALIE